MGRAAERIHADDTTVPVYSTHVMDAYAALSACPCCGATRSKPEQQLT
jgi:hypothetical protein